RTERPLTISSDLPGEVDRALVSRCGWDGDMVDWGGSRDPVWRSTMRTVCMWSVLLLAGGALIGHGATLRESEPAKFIEAHVARVAPLWTQANLTYWDATTTGRKEAWDTYETLQLKIRQLYSDREDFARIKVFRESGPVA